MGFGRIGRNVFRILYPRDDIEVVAIVDIADPEALEYLLKFDTVHGRFEEPVWIKGDSMYAKGRQIRMLQARRPGDVDWGALRRGHRDRGHRQVPPARAPAEAPRQGRQARDPDRAPARRDRRARRHGGQRPLLDAEHAHREQRLVHGQRPRADLQDPPRRLRDRSRVPDHRPRVHERPAPRRRAAHRDAPLARRRGEHHPHDHLVAPGRGADPARARRGSSTGWRSTCPFPTARTWTSSP